MSKSKRILYWKFLYNIIMRIWKIIVVLSIVVTLVISIPALRNLFLASGPIYYSQSDQRLKTVFNVSKITKNLTDYYKFDIEPALDLKIKEGYYTGSGSFKFFKSSKRKMYVSLLKDILSRNEDQIEYYINEDAKVIFIRPKTNLNNSSD